MAKRHRDALSAQHGACNTLALANSLAEAIKEARAEHGSNDAANRDAAVRLIAHQLAYLLDVREFDRNAFGDVYNAAVNECERASMADHERARAG